MTNKTRIALITEDFEAAVEFVADHAIQGYKLTINDFTFPSAINSTYHIEMSKPL